MIAESTLSVICEALWILKIASQEFSGLEDSQKPLKKIAGKQFSNVDKHVQIIKTVNNARNYVLSHDECKCHAAYQFSTFYTIPWNVTVFKRLTSRFMTQISIVNYFLASCNHNRMPQQHWTHKLNLIECKWTCHIKCQTWLDVYIDSR